MEVEATLLDNGTLSAKLSHQLARPTIRRERVDQAQLAFRDVDGVLFPSWGGHAELGTVGTV